MTGRLCACGCGTPVSERHGSRWARGHNAKVRGPWSGGFPTGENHPRWKGGRTMTKDGYVLVKCPEHPRANPLTGYVFEHILVLEEKLGRPLEDGEISHHENENPSDNRPENLGATRRGPHMNTHRATITEGRFKGRNDG